MCFDRFQFQFLYQRFQPQSVQLLLTALGYVMVNEVDKIPDNDIDEEIEGATQYKQQRLVYKFLFAIIQQTEMLAGLHVQRSGDQGENNGDKEKMEYLLFHCFLQGVEADNSRPHDVRENDAQEDKDPQPCEHQPPGFNIPHFLKRNGKNDIDQGK